MPEHHKSCQSRGMPLQKDPEGSGTEASGATSTKYCSHSYQAGRFTDPRLTVELMQALVKGKMKDMGFPGFLAGMFARGIPKLERWSQTARDVRRPG